MTSRLEYRNADLENRVSLSGGLYREPVAGHAFSLSLLALSSELPPGQHDMRVDVGSAGRIGRSQSRWILLNRLDLLD